MRFIVLIAAAACLCRPASASDAAAAAQYYQDRVRLDELARGGEFDAALALAKLLNSRNPDDSLQWRLQGRMAERLGDWPEAAAAYEKSMALGSTSESDTSLRIARAHARSGKKEAALTWLKAALGKGLDERFNLIDDDAFIPYRDDLRFVKITGLAAKDVKSRTKRWRMDIDFLIEEAQRLHADPARPAHSKAFIHAAEDLKSRVATLSDTEIMMEMQKIIVQQLGDGHSFLWAGFVHEKGRHPANVDARSLPVFFHPFENDVYIIRGQDEGAELIGGRVISIGGKSIEEFNSLARPYIHHDNSESWKFIGVQFVFRVLALHSVLGTEENAGVSVSVEFPDKSRKTAFLRGGEYEFTRKLRPLPGQKNPPRFLQFVDKNYWSEPIERAGAYYMQINNIRNAENDESLEAFSVRAVDDAIDRKSGSLIVDFRLNNGGDSTLCDGLLKNLQRYQYAAPESSIFVITRHETFSAAQNCSTRIENGTNAKFVGEPSSSRPNFTGEETQVMLPYSGFVISISNRYWQESQPTDNRPWIPMDMPAALTFEAYSEGRDPALEAIFAVLEAEK